MLRSRSTMFQVDDAALADTEWLKQAIVAPCVTSVEMNRSGANRWIAARQQEAERVANDNRSFY